MEGRVFPRVVRERDFRLRNWCQRRSICVHCAVLPRCRPLGSGGFPGVVSPTPQRFSASACGRACARDVRERDAEHRAGTDAKFSRRFAHRQAAPASLTDSFLKRLRYRRSAKLFALVPGPRKASTDPFLNHGTLKLGKDTHHLKHGLAGGCRRVEALLVQEQVNAERVQFRQEADQVLQASAQPINAPSHYHVELAARSRFAERIEGRPAIAALRAANAVVLVNFDDLAAHLAGNLAQLTFLVGRGLIHGRDPQIENSAFHRKKALVFDAGTIAHLRVKKHQIFDAEMPSA